MPVNPFAPPQPPSVPPPTLEDVVAGIHARKGTCARNLLATYQGIQASIWANEHYTPQEIAKALGDEEMAALQVFAVLTKTVANTVWPGTIVDTVPEATLTMPE